MRIMHLDQIRRSAPCASAAPAARGSGDGGAVTGAGAGALERDVMSSSVRKFWT